MSKPKKPTEGQRKLKVFMIATGGSIDGFARLVGLSYSTARSLCNEPTPRKLDYATVLAVTKHGGKVEWLPLL